MGRGITKDTFVFFGNEDDVSVIKPFFNGFTTTDDIAKATKGVVVGGDGCILNDSVKYTILEKQLPVIKVHFRSNSHRSLGYTSDVNVGNIKRAVSDLERDLYSLNKLELYGHYLLLD